MSWIPSLRNSRALMLNTVSICVGQRGRHIEEAEAYNKQAIVLEKTAPCFLQTACVHAVTDP